MVAMIVVHTLTQGKRDAGLDECVRSVARCAGDVVHAVSYRRDDFIAKRWRGLTRDADFVGFVDDDDRLVGDPIAACAHALRDSGAGVAFTYDRTIDAIGGKVREYTGATDYARIGDHPYAIRQFALFRRECITPAALVLAQQIGPHVLDLAIKAQVACDFGAVQVPMIGYERRAHAGGMSRTGSADFRAQWSRAQPALAAWLARSGRSGPIPRAH